MVDSVVAFGIAPRPQPKGVVCVDFDGTMVQYDGWKEGPVEHPPLEGVIEALHAFRAAGYRVVVFTARDRQGVFQWLIKHDIEGLVDDVSNVKPKDAVAFFDDRAHHVRTNRPLALLATAQVWLDTNRPPVEVARA